MLLLSIYYYCELSQMCCSKVKNLRISDVKTTLDQVAHSIVGISILREVKMYKYLFLKIMRIKKNPTLDYERIFFKENLMEVRNLEYEGDGRNGER